MSNSELESQNDKKPPLSAEAEAHMKLIAQMLRDNMLEYRRNHSTSGTGTTDVGPMPQTRTSNTERVESLTNLRQ
jgi:hypothetical protein